MKSTNALRVGAEDLDLAERRTVEQRDAFARGARLALDRLLGASTAVLGGAQPAAILAKHGAVVTVHVLQRQALDRGEALARGGVPAKLGSGIGT